MRTLRHFQFIVKALVVVVREEGARPDDLIRVEFLTVQEVTTSRHERGQMSDVH